METKQKNILVIDDSEEIREIIQAYLGEKNCQFFLLPDGDLGLQIYHDNDIDLVICDMVMPHCDGIELIQKIKIEDPDAKILGISGGGEFDYLELAQEFGATSILYKPFTKKQLLEKIDSIGFSFQK